MITFSLVHGEQYSCGFPVDDTYKIYIDNMYAGIMYVNHLTQENAIYLEYIKFENLYIHQGYFTDVLFAIFQLYSAKEIYFRCSDDLYPMYEYLQAEILERDTFAEITEMKLSVDTLRVKKALDWLLPTLDNIAQYDINENISPVLNEVLADVQNLRESIRRLYPRKKELK